MPVARQSSSVLPGSGARSSATIVARSPLGLTAGASGAGAGAAVTESTACGSESWGSTEGSSMSGTGTVGTDAVSAGTTGLAEGPAWAGAKETALSVAQISSADRSEANMNTVKRAVNPRKREAEYSRLLPQFAPGCSPSRVASYGRFAEKMPPALVVVEGFPWLNGGVNPRRSFQR